MAREATERASAEIAAANALFQEQYLEGQRRELQRLRADRQGEVMPPRGAPTGGQPGALPGMTQVVGPTPRPNPVQLPPITSLLDTGVIEPVTRAGDDGRLAETTLPVDPPVTTDMPASETPATNEQGQESRAERTTTTTTPADEPPVAVETAAASQARTEVMPPTEQVAETVNVELPPVTQEPEHAVAETPPVDQPQPEAAVPEEPVAQVSTPVVTRPRRKRRGSTTSAPGDLNPESSSDTTAGEIYHSVCHGHGLISQ